ncbi:MAG TPA: response regulator [Chloroflexota bacterium]|jgi:DNA-binding response OmpR family regulator
MALILAIEDHDEVLTMLSVILQHHQMLLAPDSTSGLRMAADMRPDLILLDVGMPDVDGLEVCRALRRNKATANTPILLVTAHADVVRDPSLWRSLGANGAIMKPFSPSRLVDQVEELLAQHGQGAG